MVYNVLAAAAEKTRAVSVSEAALYALLGFLTVFVGIALLIFIVWLVGKIITKVNGLKKQENAVRAQVSESLAVADGEEITEETVAAITAAIMAYYQEERRACEFRVKRIKKL